MNDLREDLDRALRAVTFSEAPVERARRDGRRIRARRRLTLLAGALAVAAIAAGYPALARSAAAPPAPATGPGPAPSPSQSDMAVDAYPAGDATEAPGGLASKSGEVAAGSVGAMKWQAYVVPPGPKSPVPADSCYALSVNAGSDIMGTCNDIPAQLGRGLGASQPAAFITASGDDTNATVVGEVSADVTYFIVTFTDGQQFKLIPVTAGGHRYIAWMAPLSMTDRERYRAPGRPVLRQRAGRQRGPVPAAGLAARVRPVAAGGRYRAAARRAGHHRRPAPWKVTAYEGPWGTCFVTGRPGGWCRTGREARRDDDHRLRPARTRPGVGFGAAAPGVATVRVTLSNGKAVTVHPVGVGNEDLFAFPVSKGVTPVSWTAYDAAGQQAGTARWGRDRLRAGL